ncbi:hypothetical protein N658DRAFT_428065 [Parathielavia hyrcaniae]|uniref:Uncharacterized protein n=1 Tax=Parathielavia hyrcaniae TaxID=113614 RepID=A0AAN6T152_9PEZI|nr:hypothetical protein N658DRAFT_428065 [Parathielavia hyrcaniae]
MDTTRGCGLAHLADHEDDEQGRQRGYIKATDFALPYFSRWSRLHDAEVGSDLLRHVNCGYLSTDGVAPTLLALKQHAQSLCILIHALAPTLDSAETGKYETDDAFDFLHDLTQPYTNDDPSHHKPLAALANEVRGRNEAQGTTTYHCPFAKHRPREGGEKQKPYANHHNLVMHANACLERLDHELSSTGGLMSLLPTTGKTNASTDLANARNSLLGQWLHFTQALVARMHDLERAHGNALDALAGEAAVPHQHLSALGPDARSSGRELLAFPQDRWVLANAGDDVFAYVHQVLDKQEAVVRAREGVFRREGVVGDGVWGGGDGGGDQGWEYAARGIVAVNIVTRYYRVAGQGPHSTLFVLPAWERHPGVAHTREVELQPTVVACVQPRFPAPVSELEKRFAARINAAQRAEAENLRMRSEVDGVRGENAVLRSQNEMLAKTRDALMFAAGDGGGGGGDGLQWAEQVQEQRERAGKAERAAREAKRERDEAVEEKESLQEELEELRLQLAKVRGRKRRGPLPWNSGYEKQHIPKRDTPCLTGKKNAELSAASRPVACQPSPVPLFHTDTPVQHTDRPAMPIPAAGRTRPPGAGPRTAPIRDLAAHVTRLRPARQRPACGRTVLACVALAMVAPASALPALPYTPTTILLPPDGAAGSGMAYIFTPTGDGTNTVDFLSVNISSLHASSLLPTKITSDLPFLSSDAGNCTTFAPSILRNGTITVFAGDCLAALASSLWTYTPDAHTPASPEWTRHTITPSPAWDNAQSGPYHLGGIITFSPQLSPVLSEPTIYLYGGMCPSPSTSRASASTWQTEATYSNRMLRLTPSSRTNYYLLDYAPAKGQQPPVAEAGFTLTELTPSFTNRTTTSPSDDDDNNNRNKNSGTGQPLVTQQTSHVLLGGHTQRAFVNMSTAAVWGLPEETWSFVSIAAPPSLPSSGDGHTDLAVARRRALRSVDAAAEVDSRSGHTTVLSEDGTRLVVYGGWVGDVGTAAQPQLAVVRVGVGLGDWEWEIPEVRYDGENGGDEEEEGGGVYGHGAVVLPGNVMMVYGGFGIPAGGGGEVGVSRRRQVAAGGGGRMFYNITNMTWSDRYVSPLRGGGGGGVGGGSTGDGSTGSDSTGGGVGNNGGGSSGTPGDGAGVGSDDSSRRRQIGLGVGLGVGLLVLAILGALAFLWFRRRQRRRAARDETIRGLAQGVNGSLPRGIGEDDEMLERYHGLGVFPWTAAAAREWYTGGLDPYSQGQRSLGYETLRGGSRAGPSLYMPPPPSASSFSNRPRGAQGMHQPSTSAYDFTPLTRAPNRIEPIYEADEDEEGDLGKGYPLSPAKEEPDDDDPFLTPTTVNTPAGGLFPPPSSHSSPCNSSPTLPPAAKLSSQGPGGQEQDPDVQDWVSDVEAVSPSKTTPTSRPSQRQKPGTTATAPATAAGTGRVSPVRRGPGSTKSARHSLVSALTESSASVDDGRTASNLSERSDFSFVRGSAAEDRVLLSRLRTTLATATTANNERTGSSGSGSGSSHSGNSYNTARSNLNFPALQAEGPSLLLGGNASSPSQRGAVHYEQHEEEEDDEEEDYVRIPGSPSKTKRPRPARRSWFGSLKRVFSGGTPTPPPGSSTGTGSQAGGESPTAREGLLLWRSDYDDGGGGGHMYGAGLRGRRQVQDRKGQGQGEGGDEEEEWDRDLERVAERRTVQIMFTVPREPLRVVNAEVEREESVLVVDPDEEQEQNSEDRDMSSSSSAAAAVGAALLLAPPRLVTVETASEGLDRGRALAGKRMTSAAGATLEPPAAISPASSLRASSITSATLHTAETVRLERPKSRVLKMVESIESLSRESSPAGSPVRGQ